MSSKDQSILCLIFLDYPRCSIELQFVRVFGVQRDGQYRPIIVMPMFMSSSPLVFIEFELFSGNEKSDYRLKLIIEPIRIIYDAVSEFQMIDCHSSSISANDKSID